MPLSDGCDALLEKRVRGSDDPWEATCYCDLMAVYNKGRRNIPVLEVQSLIELGESYGIDQLEFRAIRN